MRRRLLVVALAISAAFNLGFVTTAVVRCCPGSSADHSCGATDEALSPANDALAARLREQLEPLRQRQASDTRQLAQLIAATEPDRTAIDACLDRLAASGREIHQIVIDTILEQQDALPEEQRRTFCRAVQQRLCDPWSGCAAEGCAAAPEAHPTEEDNPS